MSRHAMKEPTIAMLPAGGGNRKPGEDYKTYRPSEYAAIYRDMIAAAQGEQE